MMIKAIFKNGSKIFSKKQSSIFSAAAVLGLAFSASALLGILRDRLLYAKFFACCAGQLDAYNAAFRIPDIIFQLFVLGTLSAAFIPVFGEELDKNKKRAYQTASSVLNLLLIIFLGLGSLIILFSRPLSSMVVSGFNSEQITLMSQLTKVIVISQMFFLVSNFLTSVLQTNQRFLVPALAPTVYNIGIILGIQTLTPYLGIWGAALGVLLGALFHFLIQLPLVIKLGFQYFPLISLKLPGVKKIVSLMPPRTLSLAIKEFQATVILIIGSGLTTGYLSLFYLGQRLTSFFSRVFGVTIGQASLPVLSQEVSKNKLSQFKKTLFNSLLQAVFLALPTAAIFLILRIPLVRLAYGAEEFPWRATLITGQIIAFLVPLVVSGTINGILGRGFYAFQDTKTPLVVSWTSLVIFIFIAVGGNIFTEIGIVGLAFATSVSSFIQALILLFLLLKKIEVENLNEILSPLMKMVVSSFCSTIVTWGLLRGLDAYVFDTTRTSGLIGLTIFCSLGGMLTYLGAGLAFKLKEARAIVRLVKSVLVWPRGPLPVLELPPRVD